jgi:hypothetical protein
MECCGTICRCPQPSAEVVSHRQGRWFVVDSESFQVCCMESATPAEHLSRHAEAVRSTLIAKWLDKSPKAAWNPRCQIVLHGSRQAYVNAVGRGSERTVGSSLVNVDQGRTVSRRIDLLMSSTDFLSAALPHELTHVLLKDHFATIALPRWADEGAAILADPQAKRGQHHMDLAHAFARGKGFSAAELLTQENYPSSDRMGAFYGQSASLARFLIDRASYKQFLTFLEQATEKGYDVALRKCYGIDGVSQLDRLWRQLVVEMTSVATPSI